MRDDELPVTPAAFVVFALCAVVVMTLAFGGAVVAVWRIVEIVVGWF